MSLNIDELPAVSDIGGVWVERSTPGLADHQLERVAFLAAWSPTAMLSKSCSRLIVELQRNGYPVVMCSTSNAPEKLSIHPGEEVDLDALTILRRPNIGYDFGSWAVLLNRYRQWLGADKVLLVNDSLVGPFAPLQPIIADFESSSADVWGLVESGQVTDHLQSHFRGFRYGCLAEPVMRDFWQNIRVIDDKKKLICAYEYGFAPMLHSWHFASDAFVDFRGITSRRHNPTIAGWRGLLDAGVPFVKRELLLRPDLVPDGREVPGELSARYGVDVLQWL